jgi:hypothetical protein
MNILDFEMWARLCFFLKPREFSNWVNRVKARLQTSEERDNLLTRVLFVLPSDPSLLNSLPKESLAEYLHIKCVLKQYEEVILFLLESDEWEWATQIYQDAKGNFPNKNEDLFLFHQLTQYAIKTGNREMSEKLCGLIPSSFTVHGFTRMLRSLYPTSTTKDILVDGSKDQQEEQSAASLDIVTPLVLKLLERKDQ